jgi:chitinase
MMMIKGYRQRFRCHYLYLAAVCWLAVLLSGSYYEVVRADIINKDAGVGSLGAQEVGPYSGTLHPGFTVFGYLPEYRLTNFDYENCFRLGVTHLIFFSLEIDMFTALPSALDRLPSTQDLRRARAAADRFGAKLLLGFGGNARSQGFSNMASTPKKRTKFLNALNKLLTEHQLDGVDYNWEYPASSAEWKNWYKLIVQSKQVLLSPASSGDDDKNSNSNGNNHNIVTFTMYADPNHFKIIKEHRLLEAADYVHCMVYDYRQRHSTIQFAEQAIGMALSYFGGKKPLIHKWTLGVPFYGRDYINGEPMAYYDLAKALVDQQLRNRQSAAHSNCYDRVSNQNVLFTELADDDTRDVVGRQYFNSQQTIRMKTHMANTSEVGGVMIWELGQDVQPFGVQSLLYGVFGCDVRHDDDEARKRFENPFTLPASSGLQEMDEL